MNALARLALGFVAVALVLAGGCRSTADRMRVLEAKNAESERNNEDLKRRNADEAALRLQAEAERERLAAEKMALQEQLDAARRVPTIQIDRGAFGDVGGVSVKEDGATIVLASDVTFRPGRADLSKGAERTLGEVATTLKNMDQLGRIRVEGHTDSDPIKKSGWKDNKQLSLARANQVRKFLMDHGIDPNILSVEGFGEAKPAASNKTEVGKAKNRRVEIILYPAE